jgi:hypothetical protein
MLEPWAAPAGCDGVEHKPVRTLVRLRGVQAGFFLHGILVTIDLQPKRRKALKVTPRPPPESTADNQLLSAIPFSSCTAQSLPAITHNPSLQFGTISSTE